MQQNSFLIKHNIINTHQHGFQQNHFVNIASPDLPNRVVVDKCRVAK